MDVSDLPTVPKHSALCLRIPENAPYDFVKEVTEVIPEELYLVNGLIYMDVRNERILKDINSDIKLEYTNLPVVSTRYNECSWDTDDLYRYDTPDAQEHRETLQSHNSRFDLSTYSPRCFRIEGLPLPILKSLPVKSVFYIYDSWHFVLSDKDNDTQLAIENLYLEYDLKVRQEEYRILK